MGSYFSKLAQNGFLKIGLGSMSPILNGAVGGVFGGATGGFAGAYASGLLMTGDPSKAWNYGISGLKMRAALGLLTGVYGGYKFAQKNNLNPWTGEKLEGNNVDVNIEKVRSAAFEKTQLEKVKQLSIKNKLYSTQDYLNLEKTNGYLQQMKNGEFNDYSVSGFQDNTGTYYVTEGNHRVSAALLYYEMTGNSDIINKLIQSGHWTPGHPVDYGLSIFNLIK